VFNIVEVYGSVLIQCECGDVISLNYESPVEKCDGCDKLYKLAVQVVEISSEEELVVE
jgi:hypothetical protein